MKKGQVEVGKDKAVVNQFYKIIDFIVQYFTSDGTNVTIDEDETIENADESADAGVNILLKMENYFKIKRNIPKFSIL